MDAGVNDKQKVTLAYAHLRRMQVTWHQWETNVAAGKYANPGATEGGKVKALLDQIGQPAPVPVPTPVSPTLGQNVMFTAWNPHAGLRAPIKYKLAITADVHVAVASDAPQAERDAAALAFIEQAKQAAKLQHDRGGLVACWGNQEQLSASAIPLLGGTIGADYPIYQAETQNEAASALAAVQAGVAKAIIGNSNSWTDQQKADASALIAAGRLAFIFETYTNTGDPWPDASSSGGVPAASVSPGVGWASHPYQLPEYKLHTEPAVWPFISPYLAEDFTSASWDVLP